MFKRLVRHLLLMAASALFAFCAAEVSLRLADVSYPSFFVADQYRGTALRPGAVGWQRTEGEAHVRINSRGLRDREHSLHKDASAFRIAVLGDSYTYASHVAVDRTFWAVLERELDRCPALAGRSVEAINFGVSGYGTTESLLTLRHEVWDYSPDLVLLAFFAGNDVADNAYAISRQGRTPYAVLEGERLVIDDSFRQERSYRFRTSRLGGLLHAAIDHSRVLQVANQAKLAVQIKARQRAQDKDFRSGPLGVEAGIENAVYRAPETPEWTEAWRITERLLETMHEEVRQRQRELLVVTLSTGIQAHPDAALRARFVAELGIDDIFYPDSRLRDFAERSGIPILVLGPAFQQYATQHGVLLHGFENSRLGFGHWNENGHQLAGEMIAARVCSQPPLFRLAVGEEGS